MERMDATGRKVRFVAVVEVEPYMYSERRMPEEIGTGSDSDAYFRACMADVGIHDVMPFEPGTNFVSLAVIAESAFLERLVVDRVEDGAFTPLCGGLSLMVDDKAVIFPECCGDLGALENWERAMRTQGPSKIWRGHPHLACEVAEGTAVITEESEARVPEKLAEVTASVEQLVSALAAVRLDVEQFSVELEKVTRKLTQDATAARVMARGLCGLRQ
jgi:hypothetical protein